MDKYLSFEMARGKMKQKSNRKDKGRPKQKGKKIKWGRNSLILGNFIYFIYFLFFLFIYLFILFKQKLVPNINPNS